MSYGGDYGYPYDPYYFGGVPYYPGYFYGYGGGVLTDGRFDRGRRPEHHGRLDDGRRFGTPVAPARSTDAASRVACTTPAGSPRAR